MKDTMYALGVVVLVLGLIVFAMFVTGCSTILGTQPSEPEAVNTEPQEEPEEGGGISWGGDPSEGDADGVSMGSPKKTRLQKLRDLKEK